MADDLWLPGARRQLKKSPVDGKLKVLIVLDARLFCVRDAKGKDTDQISDSMLQQAATLFQRVVILPVYGWVLEKPIREAVARLGLAFEVEDPLQGSVQSRVELLKKKIMILGGRIKPHKNPREISHLNIDKYTEGDHILFARKDDWERLGLKLDKPETFEDHTRNRKRKAFW